MWQRFLQKLVKWLDPKLDKYRVKKKTPPYTPKTLEEFIGVMQRTPRTILSEKDRERIAAVMSFDERTVGELMTPKSKMVFVKKNEMLGPLTLDKLYKSGFLNFPVVDAKEKVVGVLHTEALNALEVRETDTAEKYIDKKVYYLHTKDSLKHTRDEIIRTNSCYFLVLSEKEELMGFLTIEMIFEYLGL